MTWLLRLYYATSWFGGRKGREKKKLKKGALHLIMMAWYTDLSVQSGKRLYQAGQQ